MGLLNGFFEMMEGDSEEDEHYLKMQQEMAEEEEKEKAAKMQAEMNALAEAVAKKLQPHSPPAPAVLVPKVYIHTFDGKTTPVVLRPGTTIEIKLANGTVVAMVSVDPNPATVKEVEEAPIGKRVVEI